MKENVFFCYDLNLAKFLRYEKGLNFLTKAKHLQTNKVFHLFFATDELQKALSEYQSK